MEWLRSTLIHILASNNRKRRFIMLTAPPGEFSISCHNVHLWSLQHLFSRPLTNPLRLLITHVIRLLQTVYLSPVPHTGLQVATHQPPLLVQAFPLFLSEQCCQVLLAPTDQQIAELPLGPIGTDLEANSHSDSCSVYFNHTRYRWSCSRCACRSVEWCLRLFLALWKLILLLPLQSSPHFRVRLIHSLLRTSPQILEYHRLPLFSVSIPRAHDILYFPQRWILKPLRLLHFLFDQFLKTTLPAGKWKKRH